MESTTTGTIQVSKAALTKLVEEGSKKEDISTHFGLTPAQTTKMLKQAGLTIRKFHKPKFTLID